MLAEAGRGPAKPRAGLFALTDQDGRAVTQASWPGKVLAIYFGYSGCPDACPTTLHALSVALDRLGPAADAVQPIFISIDPARDTQAVLKDYVALFHSRLVGLTGSDAAVADAAKSFGVFYAKRVEPGRPADDPAYLMDHSSILYIEAPGQTLHLLPGTADPEAMEAALRAAIEK